MGGLAFEQESSVCSILLPDAPAGFAQVVAKAECPAEWAQAVAAEGSTDLVAVEKELFELVPTVLFKANPLLHLLPSSHHPSRRLATQG